MKMAFLRTYILNTFTNYDKYLLPVLQLYRINGKYIKDKDLLWLSYINIKCLKHFALKFVIRLYFY